MAAMGSFARTWETKYHLHLEINESQPFLRARISLTLPPEDLPKSCPVSVHGAFCLWREEEKSRESKNAGEPLPKNSYIMLDVRIPPAGGIRTSSNIELFSVGSTVSEDSDQLAEEPGNARRTLLGKTVSLQPL